MVSAGLKFEVVIPRIKWGTYVQNLFRPRFGGGFSSYSGGRPTVVATNARGESREVANYPTKQDAEKGLKAMERDFNDLDPDAWSERYDVPLGFVT